MSLYCPSSFAQSDRETLFELIDAYGFATLVSGGGTEPFVSHVPLLLDRETRGAERLLGHVARANPHWEGFDGSAGALAIFHGPHGYVSPAWYVSTPQVPTWNYAVVHVTGRPRVLDTTLTRTVIARLVEQYEGSRTDRWSGELPPAFVDGLVRAIVGFEIPIETIEGKFKLSQNREARDREGALAGLEREGGESATLAAFSRRYFAGRG
jgi:transcriptional regulator